MQNRIRSPKDKSWNVGVYISTEPIPSPYELKVTEGVNVNRLQVPSIR